MRKDNVPAFESDLRMSPEPVLMIQTMLVVVSVFIGCGLPEPWRVLDFALLVLGLTGAGWVITSWKPRAARWFVVAELIAIFHLVNVWFELPRLSGLLIIPIPVAAALIGIRAASVVVIAETLLVWVTTMTTTPPPSAGELTVTLASIWASLGALSGVYHPVFRLAAWSWAHSERARTLLEEARDQRVQLKQALEDLAFANRQLALLNEKLAAARLRLEEAQKSKTAFVSNVSHEFRTPLNMIIGLIDLVCETPEIYGEQLPPPLLEDLQIVDRNCKHLSSMIDDVLDLSRVEAKRLALHMESVDLAEVIEQALIVVQPLLDKKGLSLKVALPDDLSDIYCDRTRIRQVILNLVSNAARFTETGRIAVRASQEDGQVTVSVADTGPGVSEEDAKRIFEPFQQSTNRALGDHRGSGLGLSISKNFVELHKGRMWLESEVGVGSTFFLTLPISLPVGPIVPPERWIAEDWIDHTPKARLSARRLEPRVVLCDETGELYPLFSGYAEQVEFIDTRQLSDATKELQASGAQAIILNAASSSDLLDSVEKARSEVPDVPIIGCCLLPRVKTALDAGARGYLLKPITRHKLVAALERVDKPLRRVLIVDDEDDTIELLTRMLRSHYDCLEIITATSGMEALDKLRTEPPDLVLLDVVMPEMDGWQVLASKNQEEAMRETPVILISGQDPVDEPVTSEILLATMGNGLSISRLLRCSSALSALLTQPD